jgi:uncharacterized OsmC-like protein
MRFSSFTAVVLAAVSLVLAAGSAAATRTPATLLAASLAAGKAQGSVHYVARAKFGSEGVTITGDAAVDRGRQQITFTKSGQTGHATVLVVNNTAYIKGDAFTLTNYMQIPGTLANRWLSVAHTTKGFKTVAEAVRLASTLDELKMTAPLQFVAGRSIGGVRTVGIRGNEPAGSLTATATLYVNAGKTPLPVVQVSTESNGASDTVTFSRWKERVTVVAPTGATPLR